MTCEEGNRGTIDGQHVCTEQYEPHGFERFIRGHVPVCFSQCDTCGRFSRVPIDPGAYARQGNGFDGVRRVASRREQTSITTCEQPPLTMVSAPPDWSDGVDDPPRGQIVTPRDSGLAGRTTTQRSAFLQQPGTSCAVDCSIDPATAKQRRVCGIHNRIGPLSGDVSPNDLDPRVGPWVVQCRLQSRVTE